MQGSNVHGDNKKGRRVTPAENLPSTNALRLTTVINIPLRVFQHSDSYVRTGIYHCIDGLGVYSR